MAKCTRIFFLTLAMLFSASCLTSCGDDFYDNSSKEPLKLSQTTVLFGKDAGTVSVGVTAKNAGWTLAITYNDGTPGWLDATTPTTGEKGITPVEVDLAANDTGTRRTATITFTSAGKTRTIIVTQLETELALPNVHPDRETNKEIKEQTIDSWYYWNAETKTTPGDYNQSYKSFFRNYIQYLESNSFDGGLWSTRQERYIYSRIERNPAGTDAAGLPSLNYGMEFDLGQYDGKLNARVLYVVPGGPADLAGLRRGDWFWKVQDIQLHNYETNVTGLWQYNRTIDTLVNPIVGKAQKLTVQRLNQATGRLQDHGTVTLMPANFNGTPILHAEVIEIPTVVAEGETPGQVELGYLVYNSFDPDYQTALTDVFDVFRDSLVSHVVLDLRYNKTGTARMAETMGNLLVPAEVGGDIFARYEFNSDQSAGSTTVNFAPDTAHGVGVSTVFILTSAHTAGAAELLINALVGVEPKIKLVVIGDTTGGMYAGMTKQTLAAEEWEYTARLLAFRCYNAQDKGNYGYGFAPNGPKVDEWTTATTEGYNGIEKWRDYWGWRQSNPQDPMLEAAVNYARGSVPLPVNPVKYATSHQKSGFPRQFAPAPTFLME